ncbi:G2/M phase-specific E3 ubiquitin-protein ligase-like [Mizuhopecten yessoensis]|uniref:G2/M phase-specific E3 ubiquitin-protein ligase-like n=1 Tax=Mizuhopecten yessoensis TaxID=6573 RepID=UPI000B4579C5|nr:G2/M phase-specific E3 ubiquitin-protein ligase-like [Mizuhopecten yessoensis]
MRAFRRKTFQEWAPLSVVFASEQGIDNGGPSRELLLLSSKSIRDLNIFEGDSNARMAALDYIALENDLYKTAGSMFAYSIAHGGPIPAFLSPVLYDAISKGVDKTKPTNGDIVDYEALSQIQAIQESQDEVAFQHAVDSVEDIISLAGCVSLATKYSNEEGLVKKHLPLLGSWQSLPRSGAI